MSDLVLPLKWLPRIYLLDEGGPPPRKTASDWIDGPDASGGFWLASADELRPEERIPIAWDTPLSFVAVGVFSDRRIEVADDLEAMIATLPTGTTAIMFPDEPESLPSGSPAVDACAFGSLNVRALVRALRQGVAAFDVIPLHQSDPVDFVLTMVEGRVAIVRKPTTAEEAETMIMLNPTTEPDSARTDPTELAAPDDPSEWAIVEIFGHRRHVGRVREEERFGTRMLRVDALRSEGDTDRWETHFYAGSAVFSMTFSDEATVRRLARPYDPPQRYLAPPAHDLDEDEGAF